MLFSRPLVSSDMRDWIETFFDWSEALFTAPQSPIVPTREFFSATKGRKDETANMVLRDVLRLSYIDAEIKLMPLDVLPDELRLDYQATSSVAGTFQETENGALICYDPELMKRPLQFINVIVHEVMHLRLAGYQQDLPGGPEVEELATDLSGIIAGFGAIQLQAADDAGWTGYLRQTTRAHALAVFLDRRSLNPGAVSAHLSTRCNKLLKKAFKQL